MTPLHAPGIDQLPSSGIYSATVQRLRRTIERRGLSVFARIDQAVAAAAAGLELQPMPASVFGVASAGTKPMQMAPTGGIDLPFRVLVWVGDDFNARASSDDPAWTVSRRGYRPVATPIMADMRAAAKDVATKTARANTKGTP